MFAICYGSVILIGYLKLILPPVDKQAYLWWYSQLFLLYNKVEKMKHQMQQTSFRIYVKEIVNHVLTLNSKAGIYTKNIY